MVVVNHSCNRHSESIGKRNYSNSVSSNLIKRSFISKNLFRQYPLLAASHRATDGALMGLILIVVIMSTLALHSQHLWSISFSSLETSRKLVHGLKESISTLETHFLTSANLSKFMVKAAHPKDNLVYLDKPKGDSRFIRYVDFRPLLVKKLVSYPVSHGY